MRILIVEDTLDLAKSLVRYLAVQDISADVRSDGELWLSAALSGDYDVIVLDIGLPKLDGLEVCRAVREAGKSTPIIMLTSRSMKNDIVTGLDSGADDYLVKPFDYEELVARIRALGRRNFQDRSGKVLKHRSIEMDIDRHEVLFENRKVSLSPREFSLFEYLIRNHGKVCTKPELTERVWGESDAFSPSRSVDVYVGYLRKKLSPSLIETRKGVGYIIE